VSVNTAFQPGVVSDLYFLTYFFKILLCT